MKVSLLIAGYWLLTSASFGQSQRPILIGVDILKPALSLVTPNRQTYRLAEATVKIPLAHQYLSITAGYALNRSDTIYRNILLNNRGGYVKVGSEVPPPSGRGLVVGWNGLLATCHETGTYSFRGLTFGDYVASLPDRRRVAIGFEGFSGYQFLLSERFVLRVTGRATVATLIGLNTHETPIYFVPGVGNTAGNPVRVGVGFGVHLLYQTPPRSKVAPTNE